MESPEQAVLTHAYTKHFDETVGKYKDRGRAMSEAIEGGLRRYLVNRIPTGGFLRAVLENNLTEATCRADAVNFGQLANIVQFCRDALPSIAWGNQARVNEWLYSPEEEVGKPDPDCKVCYGEGTYWEDVAGDGGSRMQMDCECVE